MVLALGIFAMNIGLVRSETASDLRTLTAIVASRALTAATAGALALTVAAPERPAVIARRSASSAPSS